MELPLFLKLIKQNFILYTIIMTGSYDGVNLTQIHHNKLNSGAIEFFDFYLDSEESFKNVSIGFSESGTDVSFITQDPKFFDNPRHFFNRDSPEGPGSSMMIGDLQARSNKKRLGRFDAFESPLDTVSISVVKSSVYGYQIILIFPKRKD